MPSSPSDRHLAARAAFADLAERFCLTPVDRPAGGRSSGVRFDGEDVCLRVDWDAFDAPWVRVGEQGGRAFGLNELVELRAPDELAALPERDAPDAVAMTVLARLTAEVASDLLAGDFSAFSDLRAARAARTRRRNQEEWGTATGESPRFTERPTLEALFSDAVNDGMVTARVYQAVWDWDFAVDALGAHLGESPERIRARLDAWEGLGG